MYNRPFRACRALLFAALATPAILLSCSSTLPVPVPVDQRILVVIDSLKDLTGDYGPPGESFESLAARKMLDDYAHRLLQSGYPKTTYTEFVTNHFAAAPAGLEPVSVVGTNGPILRLSGTVEQIVYGQPDDIEKYIVNTWMLEVWSVLKSGNDDRAAFVEYHISVDDARSGENLKTLIIQGGYRQSGADRERIIGLANKVAAEALVYELNKEVGPMLGHDPKTQTWEGERIDEYTSALRSPGELD